MKRVSNKQSGAALVIGLIMLLVMTLIGVTSMNSTRTELKIANNFSNHSKAFQTAALMIERAMVDPAIIWLDADTTATSGSYLSGYQSPDELRDGRVSVVFVGCRAVAASSITGSAGKALVHEITVVGSEKNSDGDVVGVSRQVAGLQTTAAGCKS